MNAPSPLRAAIVFSCLLVVMTALAGRVAYLETKGAQQNIQRAERQQFQRETLYARRGSIYDRNGMLMAGTVQSESLFVDPAFMAEQYEAEGKTSLEMDKDVAKLANLIDREPVEVSTILGDHYKSRFERVADNLDVGTMKEIEKLDLPGIGFTPINVRYYPMGSVGSHVLGGVGNDGGGLEGLELKFNDLLKGRDGYKRTMKDARRRPIAVQADDYLLPQHGRHLILSVDANIQLIAEQELKNTCDEFDAKTGEVVVMDPKTGEILALANWPAFNPQDLNDSTPERRRNRALTDPYEPGSTIKPFIVGPALASGKVRVDEILQTASPYKSPLRSKMVGDVHSYDHLSVWDVLVKSSNIGMTKLGERLGKTTLNASIREFGFGKRTGVELPGEDPGLVIPPAKMSDSDVVSNVQGYAVMVTPVQLARAMCVYANGGKLVEPTLLRGVVEADGSVTRPMQHTPPERLPQVLNQSVAGQVRRVLCDVVIRGTATKARSLTWNIFGKTGTAHSAVNGQYNDSNYTSSFLGGAPFENPRLVIAMIIHNPDKSKAHFGGTVSAPGAARVLERSLAYLHVPASPDLPLPPSNVASGLYAYDPKIYARTAKNLTASARE